MLADWGNRALGLLLDTALFIVPYLVLYVLGLTVSGAFLILAYLLGFGWSIFLAVQLGRSGATPGMRVIGLRCIGMRTGQPIGGGMGFVRYLCHIVDGIICFVGYLWPLWDRQRQTLADKMVSTVVITVPKQPFSLTSPR